MQRGWSLQPSPHFRDYTSAAAGCCVCCCVCQSVRHIGVNDCLNQPSLLRRTACMHACMHEDMFISWSAVDQCRSDNAELAKLVGQERHVKVMDIHQLELLEAVKRGCWDLHAVLWDWMDTCGATATSQCINQQPPGPNTFFSGTVAHGCAAWIVTGAHALQSTTELQPTTEHCEPHMRMPC